MKTLRLISLLVIVGVVACTMGKTKNAGKGKPRPVKIEEHYVLIPGTEISQKDQDDIKAILKQFDASLYKVRPYEQGKAQNAIGKLTDLDIDKGTRKEIAAFAKEKGLTSWTTKIGRCCVTSNPTPSVPPIPPREPSCSTSRCTRTSPEESDKLVKQVTPILKKYE